MTRHRSTLAAGLALAYSLALLGDNMLYVFLPSHPAAAGLVAADLGLVLSANRIVRLGANSVGGLLSDRSDRRGPYLLGMVLALASTAGYLACDSLWPLVFWRVVWGIAFSLISVGGIAIILDLSRADERGRRVGGYQSMIQLGSLLGFGLAGFLTDALGYRGSLAVYVPLAALGLGIALWVLGEPAPRPLAGRPTPGAGLATLASLRALDRRLLVPAYVNFASFFAGSGVVMATLGVYVQRLAAEPGTGLFMPVASLTGLLMAVRGVAAMAVTPIAGHALDRLGDRRLVAAAGALVSLAALVILAMGRSVAMVGAGAVLLSIGGGLIRPAVVVWTSDGAPPHLRGVVMGGLATAGDLGAALGPLVAYALLETAGLRAVYGLCALLTLTSLVPLALVRAPAAVAERA